MNKIQIVIADDHTVMRMGLRNLINSTDDLEVIGEAANGVEALDLLRKLHPDVLMLDMQMPVMDGVEVAEKLHSMGSPVKVLAFSAYNDRYYVEGLLEYGAAGYVLKDEDPPLILEAIRTVATKNTLWVSRRISGWKKWDSSVGPAI